MRPSNCLGLALALGMVLARPPHAEAQRAVCPPPNPEAAYHVACAQPGRMLVGRALWELAIDHAFKADVMPLRPRPGDLFRDLAAPTVVEENPALARYLDALRGVKLSKIDTATGTLELDVEEHERSFSSPVRVGDASYELSWHLPARLVGGYWRTPGALQIAFWKGSHVDFTLAAPDGAHLENDVRCVAISTDGVRLMSGGAASDVLISFDACD